MLNSVKEFIESSKYEPFSSYYQNYVRSCQDSIIDNDIYHTKLHHSRFKDTLDMMQGLNMLTEELKCLEM